jgi:hypothetical protein
LARPAFSIVTKMVKSRWQYQCGASEINYALTKRLKMPRACRVESHACHYVARRCTFLTTLCDTSACSASCMLKHAIIQPVLAAQADRCQRSVEGCNRPIASRCFEPVAERWSLHPFSI